MYLIDPVDVMAMSLMVRNGYAVKQAAKDEGKDERRFDPSGAVSSGLRSAAGTGAGAAGAGLAIPGLAALRTADALPEEVLSSAVRRQFTAGNLSKLTPKQLEVAPGAAESLLEDVMGTRGLKRGLRGWGRFSAPGEVPVPGTATELSDQIRKTLRSMKAGKGITGKKAKVPKLSKDAVKQLEDALSAVVSGTQKGLGRAGVLSRLRGLPPKTKLALGTALLGGSAAAGGEPARSTIMPALLGGGAGAGLGALMPGTLGRGAAAIRGSKLGAGLGGALGLANLLGLSKHIGLGRSD